MPVLCGDLRSHQVRASSVNRKSKQGSRKAHARSRCRKVANESMVNALCAVSPKNRCVVASALAKRTKKGKRVSKKQAGGASECRGKSRENCVAPCAYRSGAKRSFCSAVGKRGSKKVKAVVVEEVAQMLERHPMLKGESGSLCNALPEKDCRKMSGKKNFPCRWVESVGNKKAYCGIASKSATGRVVKQKAGRQQRRSRQQQQRQQQKWW